MSVEAITWALNLAPVPLDPTGKPNPPCAAVLIGLANHAGPDGTDAFPSTHTLVRYTRLSRRTVQTALDRLEASGVISPSDPAIVAAKIKRADRRPQGWDLDITQVRDDLDDDDLTALERLYPGIRARVTAARNGVQLLHPVDPATSNGVQLTHERGATDAERGAAAAPEPYIEPEPKDERPGSSSPAAPPAADAPKKDEPGFRDDVDRVCDHLATRLAAWTTRPPKITKDWRTSARLLIDADGFTEKQVHYLIDWCQNSTFWRPNIQGMPKLRGQREMLRGQILREREERQAEEDRKAQREVPYAATGGINWR